MAVLSNSTNTCKACKQELPIDMFYRHWKASQSRYFYDNCCKRCVAEQRASVVLTEDQLEAKRLKFQAYAKVHRKKRSASLQRMEKHRAYEREYRRRMRHTGMFLRTSPKDILNKRMSTHIRKALRTRKSGASWESLVGFGLEQLVSHLEKQFSDGMSWSNIGEWHIDHRLPQSVFDYQHATDEGFKACWALSNLQPMWALDNISKGNQRIYLI